MSQPPFAPQMMMPAQQFAPQSPFAAQPAQQFAPPQQFAAQPQMLCGQQFAPQPEQSNTMIYVVIAISTALAIIYIYRDELIPLLKSHVNSFDGTYIIEDKAELFEITKTPDGVFVFNNFLPLTVTNNVATATDSGNLTEMTLSPSGLVIKFTSGVNSKTMDAYRVSKITNWKSPDGELLTVYTTTSGLFMTVVTPQPGSDVMAIVPSVLFTLTGSVYKNKSGDRVATVSADKIDVTTGGKTTSYTPA